MCYTDTRVYVRGNMRTKKNKSVKKAKISHHPSKMSLAAPEKTRLVLSCTEEEKRYIRILAALEDKSISDYLLSKPRKEMSRVKCDFPGCNGIHEPNEETAKALRDTEAGINLESHDSLKDFWKAMGMKPDARD